MPIMNRSPMQTRAKIVSFSSWLFSAEGVLRLCEVVAIFAGILTVGALVDRSVAGKIVNDRQAMRILELERKREDGAATKGCKSSRPNAVRRQFLQIALIQHGYKSPRDHGRPGDEMRSRIPDHYRRIPRDLDQTCVAGELPTYPIAVTK